MFELIQEGVLARTESGLSKLHFDWLVAATALAAVVGGIVGILDALLLNDRSTVGRIGRWLAFLNTGLVIAAWWIWLVSARVSD
jgi:hypothetical protein